MKIGIAGLPQSGKKTFFRLLTGIDSGSAVFGVCKIRDPRLDFLSGLYQPKKMVRGEIECHLLPSIVPGSGSFKPVLEQIKKLDALCLVVRDFSNESVFHINTTVDAARDINNIMTEMILNDLMLAETRLSRIAQEQKRNYSEDKVKEEAVLTRVKAVLDEGKMLSTLPLTEDEQKTVASLSFVSSVSLLLLLNVSEDAMKDTGRLSGLASSFPGLAGRTLFISAKIEQELAALPDEDRKQFMDDLGIKEPATDYLTRVAASALDLVTFFTVGKDETRAWMIKKGSSALLAAGKIHTDIARGFIRAEIFKYSDLEKLGSEEKIKENGLFYLKGKDYTVEDGDIVCFRFNV